MSYNRVTKSNPCPVCKKPDWCRVFADGWAECMRVQSDRAAKSGGWMHRIGDAPRQYVAPPAKPAAPTINATKLMLEWLAATTPTALAEFAAALGLSAASLVAVGAAWSAPHSAWAFPMADGHGNTVGIRLRNEHGKFAVRGSRQGIFTRTSGLTSPAGIQQVADSQGIDNQAKREFPSGATTLYVCEGPTDTAAAIELGLFAVGRPNCCCGGPEIRSYARRHQCQRVVMVSDNDKPGLDGACKVGAEIKLPFAVVVPPAKDLREFVQLGGTRAMIENTLKGTIWRNG